MSKTRSDSLLSQLTEGQQAQVYDWLVRFGYTETLNKIAAPPPDGFGLHTHRNSLQRFFRRYSQDLRTEDVAAAKENRFNTEDASVLVSDAEHSFLHAGHQIATGPMNTDDFAKVSRWLESHKDGQTKLRYLQLAHRQADLAEKRHAFDREKYELNVARLARKHAFTLQRIHAGTTLDTQARIRAAREALYGPASPSPQSQS